MKTNSSIGSSQLTVLGKILKKLDDMPKWYAESDWSKNLSKRDILDKIHITFIEIKEELGQIKDVNNVAYSIIHEKLETINSRCWSVKKASGGLETNPGSRESPPRDVGGPSATGICSLGIPSRPVQQHWDCGAKTTGTAPVAETGSNDQTTETQR